MGLHDGDPVLRGEPRPHPLLRAGRRHVRAPARPHAGRRHHLGHRGNALALDGTHWIDDRYDPHYGAATREYARTQTNLGEPQNPVWQNGPYVQRLFTEQKG